MATLSAAQVAADDVDIAAAADAGAATPVPENGVAIQAATVATSVVAVPSTKAGRSWPVADTTPHRSAKMSCSGTASGTITVRTEQ